MEEWKKKKKNVKERDSCKLLKENRGNNRRTDFVK